ncbi:hypothetical protein Bca52824_026955 [Brassica carinata]|uniref:Uncharacterized protein n=1 Tax=Brassica carinata TaxID=52824 RepID=A0A8X7SJ14_BRACI|nr:hypothetical protein Bca52824_026955 [Brassica carinata]
MIDTSPDSLLSVAKALAIASLAISSTNRHPFYCADSTSICSLIRRLSADSNLNELVIGYEEEEEEQILNMGHDYSYSQPSESEEYGGYTVDSGYSEIEDLIRQDQAEISYNNGAPVQYPPQPEVEFGFPQTCYCCGQSLLATFHTINDPDRHEKHFNARE